MSPKKMQPENNEDVNNHDEEGDDFPLRWFAFDIPDDVPSTPAPTTFEETQSQIYVPGDDSQMDTLPTGDQKSDEDDESEEGAGDDDDDDEFEPYEMVMGNDGSVAGRGSGGPSGYTLQLMDMVGKILAQRDAELAANAVIDGRASSAAAKPKPKPKAKATQVPKGRRHKKKNRKH